MLQYCYCINAVKRTVLTHQHSNLYLTDVIAAKCQLHAGTTLNNNSELCTTDVHANVRAVHQTSTETRGLGAQPNARPTNLASGLGAQPGLSGNSPTCKPLHQTVRKVTMLTCMTALCLS